MAKRAVYPWVLGIAVLVVVSGAFHLVGWSLANGIYFATALMLLWYTMETRNMRLQMARQNDMAVRPLLVTAIEVVKEETTMWSRRSGTTTIPVHSEALVIHNIGRGPALSVHIEDVAIDLLRVSFETVDVIPAEATAPARATVYVEGVLADDKGTAFVAALKSTSNRTFRLTVRYRDIARQSHFSVMQMGQGGARLLEHSGGEV